MNPRPPTTRQSRFRKYWHGDVLFLVLQRSIASLILLSFTPHLLIFPFLHGSHGTHHDASHHENSSSGDGHHGEHAGHHAPHDKGHDPHYAAKADAGDGSDHGGDHGEHAEHPDHIEPEEDEFDREALLVLATAILQSYKDTGIVVDDRDRFSKHRLCFSAAPSWAFACPWHSV